MHNCSEHAGQSLYSQLKEHNDELIMQSAPNSKVLVTVQDLTDALRAGIQYRLSNNSIIEKKYFLRSWLHSCGFYLPKRINRRRHSLSVTGGNVYRHIYQKNMAIYLTLASPYDIIYGDRR